MANGRLGIWLIGARGGVATTATVGLCALARGLVGEAALVSRLPALAGLDLPGWNAMVVGGHEIRGGGLRDEAQRLAEDHRAFDPGLVRQSADLLDEADGRIRPGTLIGCGPTISALADMPPPRDRSPREAVERLKDDIRRFSEAERLAGTLALGRDDELADEALTTPSSVTRPAGEVQRLDLDPGLDPGLHCIPPGV